MPRRTRQPQGHPELDLPEVRKSWQTEGLFSDHYLRARIRQNTWWPTDEQTRPLWHACKDLYEKRYLACARNNEAFTRQELLDKLLQWLGFAYSDNLGLPETQQDLEPDYLLYASAEDKERVIAESRAARYRAAAALLEAKKLKHPLSQLSRHQQRYPHQQIRDYLAEAGVLTWGILTNGNEWRLYCREAKPRQFFALNFEWAILSLDNFRYFLALFSPSAFARDAQGRCRLDAVRESALAAQAELEEDLRRRVFGILEVLANGFRDWPANGIADADLASLYRGCLVLLYRLLFVLYAEGRQLLPVEPKSRRYYKDLSLARLVTPLKGFTDYDGRTRTRLYEDVLELWHLIGGSEPRKNAEYSVPQYNGGLFDPARYPELERWRVCDAVLAEVLRGLIFSPVPEPGQPSPPVQTVDYADLRVQQLGSIYEGLLEHHFGRDGERLVLQTDKAERKATGTYYTPDYIVKYIVENTVGPLVAEIGQRPEVKAAMAAGRQDNSFAEAVLALNLCDPAMGSGHFLVEATTYLADQIVYHPTSRFQAEFARGESQDEAEIAYWRRRVVEACIYGVDLNPLAVELAKLSLWLTTIATDQPLNFLDHHLRCGNSLIGARLDGLGQLPDGKGRRAADERQLRLGFGPDFAQAVAGTIGQLQRIEAESSRDVATVKDKEKRWLTRILPRLAPYREVADLWVDTFFGHPLTEEEYFAKAREILPTAELTAERLEEAAARYRASQPARTYFHWELEFPEVFFGDDGAPLPNPGFDAVIGNPPWMGVRTGGMPADLLAYLRQEYASALGQFDLAATFLELACRLSARQAWIGQVVPKRILTNESYEGLRSTLAVARPLGAAIDLGVTFAGVDTDAAILVSGGPLLGAAGPLLGKRLAGNGIVARRVPHSACRAMPFHIIPVNSDRAAVELITRIAAGDVFGFGEVAMIVRGAECGMNHPAVSREPTAQSIRLIDHLDMDRHFVTHQGWYLDPSRIEPRLLKATSLYATVPKLLIRFLSADLVAAKDAEGFASTNLVYHAHCRQSPDFLCSLLCSRLLSFWYRTAFQNDEVKFPHVQKSHLLRIPIRRIVFATSAAERMRLGQGAQVQYATGAGTGQSAPLLEFVAAELAAERADVVHDLLAFLAERMLEMNREKHATATQFLTDLRDFHGIEARGLKPKTRLDEFWQREVPDFFAHLRANARALAAAGVRLDTPDEEKLRGRFLAARDAIRPLEARIAFTDRLIDQVVYRLYGLTEEEIRLVEGNA